MIDHTDRSTEALLARRAIAEKVTPGPWKISSNGLHIVGNINGRYLSEVAQATVITDAVHIVSNDPQTIIADIEEILRLRAEVECLEKEADWLAERTGKMDECRFAFMGQFSPCHLRCQNDCRAAWREAARKAVEEEACPKN